MGKIRLTVKKKVIEEVSKEENTVIDKQIDAGIEIDRELVNLGYSLESIQTARVYEGKNNKRSTLAGQLRTLTASIQSNGHGKKIKLKAIEIDEIEIENTKEKKREIRLIF